MCSSDLDQLALRRNFKFEADEKVLIVEDVITRGGRVLEALTQCRAHGAEPVAVGVIVDRSQGKTSFDVPHHSLAELSFPTYQADKLPPELQGSEAIKHGSRDACSHFCSRSWGTFLQA